MFSYTDLEPFMNLFSDPYVEVYLIIESRSRLRRIHLFLSKILNSLLLGFILASSLLLIGTWGTKTFSITL